MSISFTRLKTNSVDWIAGPEVFFLAGEHRFFSAELFRRCVRALADK